MNRPQRYWVTSNTGFIRSFVNKDNRDKFLKTHPDYQLLTVNERYRRNYENKRPIRPGVHK